MRCSPRSTGPAAEGHTTNLATTDSDGNACVLTSSLGLGTGDFLPGLDLQLNSMLGEVDLVLEPLAARRADAEHDGAEPGPGRRGPALAIGSAGGTRLRTALVGVAAGILDEGLDPVEAVARPRFHRAGDVVNAEPGVDEQALAARSGGLRVRRWPAQHHYFGGVSLVARAGLQAIRGERSRHAIQRSAANRRNRSGQPGLVESVPPLGFAYSVPHSRQRRARGEPGERAMSYDRASEQTCAR